MWIASKMKRGLSRLDSPELPVKMQWGAGASSWCLEVGALHSYLKLSFVGWLHLQANTLDSCVASMRPLYVYRNIVRGMRIHLNY